MSAAKSTPPTRAKDKQVEFKVNGVKQDYSMKLGEGGEAFFVFETNERIPAALQTSPLVSPAASPRTRSEDNLSSTLQEPEYLDLDRPAVDPLDDTSTDLPILSRTTRASSDLGMICLPPSGHDPCGLTYYRCHYPPLPIA